MAEFGQTTHERPDRVDQLLGSSLMSHLDRLDVVARKIFAGKIQGERRSRRRCGVRYGTGRAWRRRRR
ncbi:MAG: hypothetical protein QGH76_03795, partial [Phycisphaerales bacterium]|nr:hypothetical protein [Phycisphaerales bacterium]